MGEDMFSGCQVKYFQMWIHSNTFKWICTLFVIGCVLLCFDTWQLYPRPTALETRPYGRMSNTKRCMNLMSYPWMLNFPRPVMRVWYRLFGFIVNCVIRFDLVHIIHTFNRYMYSKRATPQSGQGGYLIFTVMSSGGWEENLTSYWWYTPLPCRWYHNGAIYVIMTNTNWYQARTFHFSQIYDFP